MNTNRTIKLYKTGETERTGSWRENMSRICNAVKNAHQNATMITEVENFAKAFDVKDNIELLMDGELPKFSSKGNNWSKPIADLLELVPTKVVAAINGISTLFRGIQSITSGNYADSTGATAGTFDPWMKNVNAFKDAGNFSISVNLKFAMGQYGLWNAKEEVVKPVLNLIIPTLPQHLNAFTIAGPAPTAFNLITEMIQSCVADVTSENGPSEEWQAVQKSFNDVFGTADFESENILTKIGESVNILGSLLEYLVLGAYKRYTYTIEFGNMFAFNRMLIKESDWKFSKEVDQNGLPVTGEVNLTLESTVPMAISTSNKNTMAVRYKFNEQI